MSNTRTSLGAVTKQGLSNRMFVSIVESVFNRSGLTDVLEATRTLKANDCLFLTFDPENKFHPSG